MTQTYKAMQISRPGVLELVEKMASPPGQGEVLIRVEACGVCGADASDIERSQPEGQAPRVPGHEVVGRIAAMGANVPPIWRVGQRVGIGRFGGYCEYCTQCRQGHFQLCQNQPVVGASCDGGYAELMLARHTGLVSIPDELSSEEAAPILCAGLATFNALRKCGAEAGDLVAIFGIGGLGHMALQYARRIGFKVVAISRGDEKAADSLALGAHVYIDSDRENAAERLKSLGGAHAIVSIVPDAGAVNKVIAGLVPRGRLVLLNPTREPLNLPPASLIGGERGVIGSITGTPFDSEKTLNFSVLAAVRPRIEVMPLAQANEALQRMKSGGARYRMVLTMDRGEGM